jgi:putative redox protein
MDIKEITTVSSQFRGNNYVTSIKSDDHEIITDEPLADGGQDAGFDPFELVLAALATCTTATMKMYADRKQWKLDKIDIQLSMQEEDGIQHIRTTIQVSGELTEEQKIRLLVIAEKCPVHKILTKPNRISTALS